MVHHMSVQLKLPLELFPTSVAVKLHFITMNPLVVKHILFLGETFPTDITYPWLLPGVYPSMKLQLALADKPDTIDFDLLVIPINNL